MPPATGAPNESRRSKGLSLRRASEVPRGAITRTFRHGSAPHFLALVVAVGLPLALSSRVWPIARATPWGVWLLAAPFLAVGGLLYLVVLQGMLRSLLGTLGPGNWVLKVSVDGVFLNLRSFANPHFGDDAETAVFVPFHDVGSAGKVVEWVAGGADRETVRVRPCLELRLPETDTSELARAIERERERKGPERSFFGIRTSGRANHVPLVVHEPGVLRLDWRGAAMLRPFAERSEILPPRRVRVGSGSDGRRDAEEQVLELVQRGEKIAAVALVRETYGMGTAEAVAFVEGLRGAA